MPGEHVDGHTYAEQVVARGAVAVVGNRSDLTDIAGAPYLRASNPRASLGIAAHALAGNPSAAMTVIGITGTNGKTSSILMTREILSFAGYSAAAFGTLGYQIGDALMPGHHTTPFAEELVHAFVQARDAGISHVAMEVSSHALAQDRTSGIAFDVAAFTNLTQDHLDYHKDLNHYRAAKLKLFEAPRKPRGFNVVNGDDPSAHLFIAASACTCYTYGAHGDCRAEEIVARLEGMHFRLHSPWGQAEVALPLLGRHNVSNALCAATIAGGLGVPVDAIAAGLAALPGVPGRFERIDCGQDFYVVVDYAHTEDGLRNVLRAAREIGQGRVIVLFGCGGDRDKTKRPKMAKACAQLADFSVVTSDNPRTEDPEAILCQIVAGMEAAGQRRNVDYCVISDRGEAIRHAIGCARPGDLVLIAGKGHEDYQIIGTQRIHFDDREQVRAALISPERAR